MTTKLIIKNAACSNGDVHVAIKSSDSAPTMNHILPPGYSRDDWVSTGHQIAIHETWPAKTPASEPAKAGERADDLISAEVFIQDKMWGDANERADSTNNQLICAATAQLSAIWAANVLPDEPGGREGAFEVAKENYYPKDWEGFRDYGSDVANLVVVAAFVRSEIKRRILLGEDTTRTKRGEPYVKVSPNMSAEEAAKPSLTY